MKKVILLLIVMLSLTTVVSAQMVRFGAKAGISANASDFNVTGDFSEQISKSIKNKAGYHLGLTTRVQLVGLYIQSDVLYVRNSYSYDLSSTETLTIKENCLDIPVVAGLKLLFLRLYAGPRFDINLGEKIEKTATNSTTIDAVMDNFWLGYQAGIGLDLFKRFSLDVSYNGYFKSPNQKFSVNENSFSAKQKSKQYWFTVGYYF